MRLMKSVSSCRAAVHDLPALPEEVSCLFILEFTVHTYISIPLDKRIHCPFCANKRRRRGWGETNNSSLQSIIAGVGGV